MKEEHLALIRYRLEQADASKKRHRSCWKKG